MTAPRTFSAHSLKGGDIVNSREVFDVIDTFGCVAILFTDGTRLVIPTWDTEVAIQN